MGTLLNKDEWKELQALRTAISWNPASVHPDRMEKFTELFIRRLEGKGDGCVFDQHSNY